MFQSSKPILLFFVCLFLPFELIAETTGKLKIGVIAPLSGGVASWGQSVLQAIQLANSESTLPAEIIFQDEETCAPIKAVNAYQYLTQQKKVDIIIASCLGGARAIAPLAKKEGIPLFISGRSTLELQEHYPNSFSWLSLLDHEGEAIAKYIEAKQWKKGVALVWNEYFGIQFAEAIKKAKPANFDLKIIETDINASSLNSETLLITKEKPDVVFLMQSEPILKSVISEFKKLNYQGQLLLQSSILQTSDKSVRSNFVGALQQKFDMNMPAFNSLRGKISKSLGSEVADDFIFSYDSYKILLEKANNCSSKKANLNDCLYADFRDEQWHHGISGKFKFMKAGYTERPMLIKKVTLEGYED